MPQDFLKKMTIVVVIAAATLLIIPDLVQARSSRTSSSDVYVRGYTRKDGTYVAPYYRTAPDSSLLNNYSCIDNGVCGTSGGTTVPITPIKYTCDSYGPNAELRSDNKCYCKNGFSWDTGMTQCVEVVNSCDSTHILRDGACLTHSEDCVQSYGQHVYGVDGADSAGSICFCESGYQWNGTKTTCEWVGVSSNEVSPSSANFDPSKFDPALVSKLKGRILLQVESHGEAWYLNPDDGRRYYLKDGAAALSMMSKFGLGISDKDLLGLPQPNENIIGSKMLQNRLSGKILLQVEQQGYSWYINPTDLKRYPLGTPDQAYLLMKGLSLGISNNDLSKIPTAALE